MIVKVYRLDENGTEAGHFSSIHLSFSANENEIVELLEKYFSYRRDYFSSLEKELKRVLVFELIEKMLRDSYKSKISCISRIKPSTAFIHIFDPKESKIHPCMVVVKKGE